MKTPTILMGYALPPHLPLFWFSKDKWNVQNLFDSTLYVTRFYYFVNILQWKGISWKILLRQCAKFIILQHLLLICIWGVSLIPKYYNLKIIFILILIQLNVIFLYLKPKTLFSAIIPQLWVRLSCKGIPFCPHICIIQKEIETYT